MTVVTMTAHCSFQHIIIHIHYISYYSLKSDHGHTNRTCYLLTYYLTEAAVINNLLVFRHRV